jgi:hypothetical protein
VKESPLEVSDLLARAGQRVGLSRDDLAQTLGVVERLGLEACLVVKRLVLELAAPDLAPSPQLEKYTGEPRQDLELAVLQAIGSARKLIERG